MKYLYLIVGKSGSGKDYVVSKMCKEHPGWKQVISRTTREKRNENDNGHLYVSELQAAFEFHNSIARTIFNGHRYYVLQEDLDGKDFYIVDPDGIISMREYKDTYNVVSIYLDIPWYKRLRNMLHRGDGIFKSIYRIFHDYKKFGKFKTHYTVKSTLELEYLVYCINLGESTQRVEEMRNS